MAKAPRIRPLPAFFGALAGAFLAVVGSGVVSIGIAFAVMPPESLQPENLQSPEFMKLLMANYPVVASSVFATAFFLIGVPVLTAKLSKASIKESLGLRGAPWLCFVLAPIGILALGPTSDRLVMIMKEIAPGWTMNALDSIETFVGAHPVWMLWPVIALAPGIGEEIFFRGLVQRAAGFGRKAIVISAISFSFFHMDPHHVAGVLPLGFYLAWLGARTGTTLVPIAAHVVNNSMALFLSKAVAEAGEGDVTAAEHLPLWSLPIGWAIAGACIYGIWAVTKDRERWLGPAAVPEDDDALSPEWRIVRYEGAVESLLGLVLGTHLRPPGVAVGSFVPGPAFEELAESLGAKTDHEALPGFVLEDMKTGAQHTLRFHVDFERAQVVFAVPGSELAPVADPVEPSLRPATEATPDPDPDREPDPDPDPDQDQDPKDAP